MFSYLSILGFAGLALAAVAEPSVVQLWPEGKIPLKTSEKVEHAVPSRGDDIVRLTDVNVPTLTAFLAPDIGKPVPAVLICPGGGYSILAWNHEGTEIAEWLNSQGVSAFVLKYRVPGQRDAAFCDAQRAMGLIRERANEFRVDPKRLGIMGFSAGAHLSVRVCTNFDKRFYEPVDDADRQSCRPDFALIIYPAYLYKKGTFEMVDDLPVTKETPPTFLVQAEDDRSLIDSSIAYFIALKAVNVPAEMHIYPSGGHGYGLRQRGKPTDRWGDLAKVWLGGIIKK